jgi:hypothetical protein
VKKPVRWTDQFIRNMIAKGSITPPSNYEPAVSWFDWLVWTMVGLCVAGLVTLVLTK